MKDLMIDIETLGTGERPIIASIGLCPFDIERGVVGEGETLYVDISDQNSRRAEPSTVLWWLQQSPEAIRRTFFPEGKKLPFFEAMKEVARLTKGAKRVWAKGTDFDLRILSDAYAEDFFLDEHANGVLIPFWKWRDCRALYDLAKLADAPAPLLTGEAHVAGDDARYQAEVVLHVARLIPGVIRG